ncbi:uncharacterized protein LOC135378723 [Ornithodoros turicata]|uniref:uncharacterized protein LOC135378723 n=1 Tax=Ornithodoros turicata TaxID=34597 RepID=UPI0031399A74
MLSVFLTFSFIGLMKEHVEKKWWRDSFPPQRLHLFTACKIFATCSTLSTITATSSGNASTGVVLPTEVFLHISVMRLLLKESGGTATSSSRSVVSGMTSSAGTSTFG